VDASKVLLGFSQVGRNCVEMWRVQFGSRDFLFNFGKGLGIITSGSLETELQGPIVMDKIGFVELWGPGGRALFDAFLVSYD